MIATFLPDAIVYHTEGTIRGHTEAKLFFENIYGVFVPGVCRSATNHIVDRDEDSGVVVRYQECLIRYGWPEDDAKAVAGEALGRNDGLPSIWWFGPITDRLRMTAEGWKIFEQYIGPAFRNERLDLSNAPKLQGNL